MNSTLIERFKKEVIDKKYKYLGLSTSDVQEIVIQPFNLVCDMLNKNGGWSIKIKNFGTFAFEPKYARKRINDKYTYEKYKKKLEKLLSNYEKRRVKF